MVGFASCYVVQAQQQDCGSTSGSSCCQQDCSHSRPNHLQTIEYSTLCVKLASLWAGSCHAASLEAWEFASVTSLVVGQNELPVHSLTGGAVQSRPCMIEVKPTDSMRVHANAPQSRPSRHTQLREVCRLSHDQHQQCSDRCQGRHLLRASKLLH
jgi:hypothetical protein